MASLHESIKCSAYSPCLSVDYNTVNYLQNHCISLTLCFLSHKHISVSPLSLFLSLYPLSLSPYFLPLVLFFSLPFSLCKRPTVLMASQCRHAVTQWGEIASFRPLISLCKCRVHKSCLLLFATIWFMRPYPNKAEHGGLGLAVLVMSEGFRGEKGLNLV